MYLPAAFAQTDAAELQALMQAHPLATLVLQGADGLDAHHLPLLFDPATRSLRGHVARANPLWQQAAAGLPVLAVFQGPQAYVSPSWYPSKDEHHRVVPTWNYAVVHAHGTLRAIDDAGWLRTLLGHLTAAHEATRPQPWSMADAPADYLDRMLAAVVGIELQVSRLEGKWKLNQNRAMTDRQGVLDATQDPAMRALLSAAMQPPRVPAQ
jgi:transcriptional regulator